MAPAPDGLLVAHDPHEPIRCSTNVSRTAIFYSGKRRTPWRFEQVLTLMIDPKLLHPTIDRLIAKLKDIPKCSILRPSMPEIVTRAIGPTLRLGVSFIS